MLIDLSVKNFGVFRDGFTLSLRKNSGEELPENVLECGSV